jgi:hypothetical protein
MEVRLLNKLSVPHKQEENYVPNRIPSKHFSYSGQKASKSDEECYVTRKDAHDHVLTINKDFFALMKNVLSKSIKPTIIQQYLYKI